MQGLTGQQRTLTIKEHIQKLIENAIDFHLHTNPDPLVERTGDALDVALLARDAGMRAIVLKGMDYPTAPLASLACKKMNGIEVVGSLVLNHAVGGINPYAVEVSAKTGAKVIWMPTVSSLGSRSIKGFSDGIPVLDRQGNILKPVKDVLALVKDYGLTIGTGHLLKAEILALFTESKKMGINKFVLTHPLKVAGTAIDIRTQKALTEKGAFIEHCFGAIWSTSKPLDPAKIATAIRSVGVDKCIVSTDLGNIRKPPPVEGLQRAAAFLLLAGFSQKEIFILIKENPRFLLNL
jgi:hypothetical protein